MSIPHRMIGLMGVACWLNLTLLIALYGFNPDDGAPPRFVDETGAPLADATLRILCYGDAASPPNADLLFTTSRDGYLQQPLPENCPQIAALQVIHRQPSSKRGRDAYWLYHTSWQPGAKDRVTANGEVVIRSDWRLALFEVAVALEWEPASTSQYLEQLRQGLALASANLYDLTDGQMAFGPVTITTGGEGWQDADVQIRAANDYRPAAHVGGIIAQTTVYTTPNGTRTVYAPGVIVLGRAWDGFDAADAARGAWDQPAAYRTLIHEWLHYALFLYDEYQDVDADGRAESYCTCRDLPAVGQDPQACGQIGLDLAASAMGYHYTASELWLDGANALCLKTDQERVHGEPDWATLERWSHIQGLPPGWLRKPTTVASGPATGLTGDLFGRRPISAPDNPLYLPIIQRPVGNAAGRRTLIATQLTPTSEISLNVSLSASLTLTDLNALQVQIYTQEPAAADKPARLIHQGATVGPRQPPNSLGQATLLGIQPGAKVWVFVEGPGGRAAPGLHFSYTGELDPDLSQQTIMAQPDPQAVDLDITPGVVGASLQSLTVTLTSRHLIAPAPVLQLCAPDAAIGCPHDAQWRKTMTDNGNLGWTAMLTAPAGATLPGLGVLQLSSAGDLDVIRWFQTLGGVGPGHRWGHAPLRDGLLMVDATTPISGARNLALLMPTASAAALDAPLPPGITGLLNLPLDVDVVLPTDAQPGDQTLPLPVVLTFFFGRETLERLGLVASHAQLLRYEPTTGHWALLPFSGRSPHLHWLATKPITQTGSFAVGRAATPAVGVIPTMLADPDLLSPELPLRYLVVLPAATDLLTPTLGFVQNGLPPFILAAQNLSCNIGQCNYDSVQRIVHWQGLLQAGDTLVFSYDLHLNPETPPSMLPPTFVNQATAHDGARHHILTATTQLDLGVSPPDPTPTPSPTETPVATPTSTPDPPLTGIASTFGDLGGGAISLTLRVTDSALDGVIHGVEIVYGEQMPVWQQVNPGPAPAAWNGLPGPDRITWITESAPLRTEQPVQFLFNAQPPAVGATLKIRFFDNNRTLLGYIVSQRVTL